MVRRHASPSSCRFAARVHGHLQHNFGLALRNLVGLQSVRLLHQLAPLVPGDALDRLGQGQLGGRGGHGVQLLLGRPRGNEGAGDAGGAAGPPREVAAADGAEVEDEEEAADGAEDEEEGEAGDDAQGAVRAADGEEGQAAHDGEDREKEHHVLVALLATCNLRNADLGWMYA